jgi:hypothetical protein
VLPLLIADVEPLQSGAAATAAASDPLLHFTLQVTEGLLRITIQIGKMGICMENSNEMRVLG